MSGCLESYFYLRKGFLFCRSPLSFSALPSGPRSPRSELPRRSPLSFLCSAFGATKSPKCRCPAALRVIFTSEKDFYFVALCSLSLLCLRGHEVPEVSYLAALRSHFSALPSGPRSPRSEHVRLP